ncbi:MAG: hypothetical protein K1W21_11370 [Oscillospiraceae bacterium]
MKTAVKANFFALMLAFPVCFSLAIPARAAGPDAAAYPEFFDAAEFQQVRDAVFHTEILYENGVLDEAQPADAEGGLETSYKMFSLKDPELLPALQNGSDLSGLISDEYVWIVATAANQSIRAAQVDGEWEVLGYSTPRSETATTNVVRLEPLNAGLATLSASQASIDRLVCFEAPMYHTNFVYLDTSGGAFLVPFGSRPDLTGLENGMLYTPEEVGGILSASFGGGYSGNGNAGIGGSAAQSSGWEPVAASGAVLLAAALGAVLFALPALFRRQSKQG